MIGIRGVTLVLCLCAVTNCRDARPIIIGHAGLHQLDRDVQGQGRIAVSITADNVVFDLAGRTIRCAPDRGSTIGISAPRRRSVTIRNGTVTECRFGIVADHGTNILVEDMRLVGNTYVGAELRVGDHNVVRHSVFGDIKGFVEGVYAIGLSGIGSNGVIERNTFFDIYRQPGATGVGEGVAVLIQEGATNVVVRDNRIANQRCETSTIGVWSADKATTRVAGNEITNFHRGVQGAEMTVESNVMALRGELEESIAIVVGSGLATGNTANGYAQLIDGGIADDGSNSMPDVTEASACQ